MNELQQNEMEYWKITSELIKQGNIEKSYIYRTIIAAQQCCKAE